MSSAIGLSSLGVGSGLNDTAMIASLVSVQQAPITTLQTKASNIQSASQSISTFSSELSALKSAALALSDPTQYASNTASSSDPSIAASASSTALSGSYAVNVSQLATAQVTYGGPQSSSTSALGMSGTLGLTVGSKSVNVTIGAGDSLATIATNISSSGMGISAAVVFDGTNYELQVQGNATGKANAIAFTETGVSLGLSAPTYQQNAQDAALTVNNIKVTSPSNQISGAIPGVTLALTSVSASPTATTTITVAPNASATIQKVSAFISAYNTAVSGGHSIAGYGTTHASNTLLTADRGIETALSQISSLVASNVPGASSTLQNLASIGITLNNDGSLALNSATLSQALASDPTSVERLFVTDSTTGATGIMKTIGATIDSVANNAGSILKTEISSYASQVQRLTQQQATLQARVTQYQKQIQAEFAAMEQTVQTQKQNFTDLGGTGTFV